MPTMDEGDIVLQLEKLPSITLGRFRGVGCTGANEHSDKVPEVATLSPEWVRMKLG